MKNTKLLLAIATSAALLTGCQNTHGIEYQYGYQLRFKCL